MYRCVVNFQSVLVTLLAVALATYLTRKSLKQGSSPPPASAPPAPSTPVPAKQPEEVIIDHDCEDCEVSFQLSIVCILLSVLLHVLYNYSS